jgi:predicted Zn finger-like uncharacterized protein
VYTQCPECLTIYRVTPETVGAGRGQLKCGHCSHVFDALPTLTEKLPLEVVGELPQHRALPPPELTLPAMHPRRPQSDMFELPPESARNGLTDGPEAAPRSSQSASSDGFRARREPALLADWMKVDSPRMSAPVRALPSASKASALAPVAAPASKRWWWGCAGLACLLILQSAYAEREWLLTQPPVRAALKPVLGIFGQELKPLAKVSTLSVLGLSLKPHPSVPEALLISATLRNSDHISLAYPWVELRLTDINEKPAALRRFAPFEYLSNVKAARSGLAAGAMVPLVFEVIDPGRGAMNYQLKLLPDQG